MPCPNCDRLMCAAKSCQPSDLHCHGNCQSVTTNLTIHRGETFKVEYFDENGNKTHQHEFTYLEWLALRKLQNALFFTEPK